MSHDMIEEVALKTVSTKLITQLSKETSPLFTDIKDQAKQFIKNNLGKYLEKQKEKYTYLKTLLKGNSPAYIYSVYYPLKLIHENEVISTNHIANIFKDTNCVTIIGDAGSGKSTLVKHLYLNCLHTQYAVPILVELRYLNLNSHNLQSYIRDSIINQKLAESDSVFERLLKHGKFVFFLDGYDELNSDIKQKVVESIQSFVDAYPQNKFLLTTRPYSDIESFDSSTNMRVKKLSQNDGEIKGFIFKQLEKEAELAEKIYDSVTQGDSQHIKTFLTNPLLLSLYILTFQSNASIPSDKHVFYRRVIQALFSEHDSKTKLGYVREKESNLNQEQFEIILKLFCVLSYFESQFNWDYDYIISKFNIIKDKNSLLEFDNNLVIKDLKSAIALWIEDNGEYSFAHRSLQEYFAALFISSVNDETKSSIYQKIISRSNQKKSIETQNLLSLLEDMDSNSFLKFYKIPLLQELLDFIDTSDDQSLVKSYLSFLAYELKPSVRFIGEKGKEEIGELHYLISVRDEVYRHIYLHLPHTKILHRTIYTRGLGEAPLNSDEDLKLSSFTPKEGLSEEFADLFFKDILPLAKEYHNFLNQSLEDSKTTLDASRQLDQDIAGLI